MGESALIPLAAAISAVFAAVYSFIFLTALRRMRTLSAEERRRIMRNPFDLYFYILFGRARPTAAGPALSERVDRLVDGFRRSSAELEQLRSELEEAMRLRQAELADREQAVEAMERRERSLADRIKLLEAQNPEVAGVFAELVDERLRRGETRALRQQFRINAMFFVAGVVVTLVITLVTIALST
jgi:hypothetical protein